MKTEDAIIALATPDGRGAISVFRISGRDLKRLLSNVLFMTEVEPLKLKKTLLRDSTGEVIDEITFIYYQAPKSYTGEDVVEVFSHGGVANSRRILDFFIKQGLRVAEPGEFTFRALLNGKISLTKAESIDAICKSENIVELNSAINGLVGETNECFEATYEDFLSLYSDLVKEIEFSEIEAELSEYKNRIVEILNRVNELISSYEGVKDFIEGVNIIIAGRTNVGKSSLFNRMVGEERSIVTEIEGTTRDVIDKKIYLGNISVRFADTAGLRETGDKVELIGQKRTEEEIRQATLLLYMIDVEKGLNESDEKILNENKNRVILLVNKIDLKNDFTINWDGDVFYISAKFNKGIDQLKEGIKNFIQNKVDWEAKSHIFNRRQYELFLNIRAALQRANEAIERGEVMDILLFELQDAKRCFERLLGKSMDEDIYSSIFSRFCIGK